MLRLALDHLKTRKMSKHALKQLLFVMRYVPDDCKTQQVCDKVILGNGGMLESVFDRYKTQETW